MKHLHHLIQSSQGFDAEQITRNILQRFKQKYTCEIHHFDAESWTNKNSMHKEWERFSTLCSSLWFLTERQIICIKNLQHVKSQNSSSKALQPIAGLALFYDSENRVLHAQQQPELVAVRFKDLCHSIVCKPKVCNIALAPAWQNIEVVTVEEKLSLQDWVAQQTKLSIIWKANAQPPFLNLLQQQLLKPVDNRRWLFTAQTYRLEQLDTELLQTLQKTCQIHRERLYLKSGGLSEWIIQQSTKHSIHLNRTEAEQLLELIGDDRWALNTELQKLALLKASGEANWLDSLKLIKNYSIFEITEFLAKRDVQNSMQHLNNFIANHSSNVLSLFGLLSSHFRLLLKYKLLSSQKLSTSQIGAKLALTPWRTKKLLQEAQHYQLLELQNLILALAALDIQLKFTHFNPAVVLEHLCLKIIQRDFANPKHLLQPLDHLRKLQ